MSSPPSGSFGDQLLCPVCFEMFEGRILQCSQGHSVCEGCVKKIHRHLNNECPQCRGAFVGTRNYILEEMVKQLKALKASVMVKKTDTAAGASDANANTVANELNSDTDDTDVVIDNAKLTKAIATLVASIPKPAKRDADACEPTDSPRPARASVTVSPEPGIIWQATPNGPPQPRGIFSCRIWNCQEKIPVCRMLNHVRTFHLTSLTESRLQGTDDEFLMHYTFKCQNFRQCIRISQYGLFFLIVNVKREGTKTIISAWVQCVGRSNECKLFTFNLQMRIGNAIAHFTDYTYGESSDAQYIEQKKQCLFYETNVSAKRLKEIAVDVKISKSTGDRTGRRRTTTTVVPINN